MRVKNLFLPFRSLENSQNREVKICQEVHCSLDLFWFLNNHKIQKQNKKELKSCEIK